MALKTGYEAAKNSEETSDFKKYLIIILVNYICILVVLPFTKVYYIIPLTCIFVISLSFIKLCWKLIITSILKFHFNPFQYDHLISIIACFTSFFIQFWNHELTIFIMIVAFVLSFVNVFKFAETTVVQIADHLKINVFVIDTNQQLITSSDQSSRN